MNRPQSFLASLFHSVIWKTTSRGASLVKHIVIAAAIGLSTQLDVFYMALAIFGLLIEVWGMTLTVLAVPHLIKLGDREFSAQAATIAVITILASMLLALAVISFRGQISHLAIGFDTSGKEALSEAILWLTPYILLHVPTSAIGAALRAKRNFSPVYQSEALNAVAILACIIAVPTHPHVLFWSLSCGAIASFLFLGTHFLLKFGSMPGVWSWFDRQVLQVFKAAPGLAVLHGTLTFFLIMDRIFASFLPGEGAISALAYAMVIVGTLPTVLSIEGAFITVAAEKNSRAKRSDTTNDLFSLIIFLSIGATAFFVVAGREVIGLLLERGAFNSADTDSVSDALVAFAFMVAPLLLLPPLDQLFQIEKRVAFMVRRTMIGIVIGSILNYVAIFILGWGIVGLAVATTISYWLIVVIGVIGLMRLGYEIPVGRHFYWAAWLGAFVGCSVTIVWILPDLGPLMNIVTSCILLGLSLLIGGMVWPGREKLLLKSVIRRLLGPIRMSSFRN